MNQLFEEVVTENPMLIEISRVRRKMTSVPGSKQTNKVVLGLLVACYLGLIMIVGNYLGDIPPIGLIIAQTGLFTMLAPALLYGAIAGERERRSWDLLLAAPLTKAQIVAGKFMGALAAIGGGSALFLLPLLMTAATYHRGSLYDAMLAESLSISFIAMVSAMTILISARVKRSMTALGVSLGVLAFVLIVVPAMTAVLTQNASAIDLVTWMNPFVALARILDAAEGGYSTGTIGRSLYGVPQIVAYLGATVCMLLWAGRTLTHADNDVVVIPRKRKNA